MTLNCNLFDVSGSILNILDLIVISLLSLSQYWLYITLSTLSILHCMSTREYKDIAKDMSYVTTFTCLLDTPWSNVFVTCHGDIQRHVFHVTRNVRKKCLQYPPANILYRNMFRIVHHAVVTTVVIITFYGGHTIEKVTQQFRVWQFGSYLTLCMGQLKDFLGLLLDSDHGFESENVNFSTWGSITRVIDLFSVYYSCVFYVHS